MPEDQGKNGDKWNDKASKLMQQLNWKQVADDNIDIIGSDNKPYGIDRLMKFIDPRRNSKKYQGVILEAKRYKWSSFSKSSLEEWIRDIDNKLIKIRNSKELSSRYPDIASSSLVNGVIFLWIVDGDPNIWEPKLLNHIENGKKPNSRIGDRTNRIYVLTNKKILELVSLIDAVHSYDKKKGDLLFYYPASDYNNTASASISYITLDYMVSKFVLAKSQDSLGGIHNVVFYFGSQDINSFRILRSCLSQLQLCSQNETLTIYYFDNDNEFRKVKPDVENDFSNCKDFKLKTMRKFSDVPDYD